MLCRKKLVNNTYYFFDARGFPDEDSALTAKLNKTSAAYLGKLAYAASLVSVLSSCPYRPRVGIAFVFVLLSCLYCLRVSTRNTHYGDGQAIASALKVAVAVLPLTSVLIRACVLPPLSDTLRWPSCIPKSTHGFVLYGKGTHSVVKSGR